MDNSQISTDSNSVTLWLRCSNCKEILYKKLFEEALRICSHCGFHYRLTALERIHLLFDENTFAETEKELTPFNVIGFKTVEETYEQTIERNMVKTGLKDSCITGIARIDGKKCVVIIFDFFFMGGSMGTVAGEKVARAFELALKKDLPIVAIVASGGARMQEGIFSLMQMAKTCLLVGKYRRECRKPFICIMTNPTTGGVLASFASLADIIISEPGALIGFAGPRVIERTVKARLPKGFQTSEFLKEKGLIDMIVKRDRLKSTLSRLIDTR